MRNRSGAGVSSEVCWRETVEGRVSEQAEVRRRILLMVPHLGGGGAEQVMARVAEGLDPKRWETHLAVVTGDKPGARSLPEWVTVHRLEAGRVRWSGPGLVRLMIQIDPQVVVPGMMHLSALTLALRPLLPRGIQIAPRVNTTVSRVLTGGVERLGYGWLMRRANRVICQTEAMAEDLCTHLGVEHARTLVAENPVDVVGIRARVAERRRQRDARVVRVLCVGRLAHEKGVDLLLEAWAMLAARETGIRLTVVGDGAERNHLEKMRRQMELTETVQFVGFDADVVRWLEESDVLVQPSRYEGMPNALLEAAAAGLALVTMPSSEGVVRLLRDRKGAWIARETGAAALAEAMGAAVEGMRERKGMEDGRFAHEFVERFAQETALQRWEQCLREVVEGSK